MPDPRSIIADATWGAARSSIPFGAWAITPNNVLLFIGIVSALVNLAYVVWKWRREARA